jgi:hypothetical protein
MSNSTRRGANEQYRFLLVNSAERAIVIWPHAHPTPSGVRWPHAQWLFVGPTPSGCSLAPRPVVVRWPHAQWLIFV